VGVAGELPHRGPQHPAAVEGEPWDEVEDADDDVGPRQQVDGEPEQPVAHHQPEGEPRHADADRGEGAHHRDPQLLLGRRGLPLDLGDTSDEVQGDGADADPVVLRHQSVRQLVEQQREGEEHGDGNPGDVLPDAQLRCRPLDLGSEEVCDEPGHEQPRRAHHDVDPADRAHAQGSGLAAPGGSSETGPVCHRPNLSNASQGSGAASCRWRRLAFGS